MDLLENVPLDVPLSRRHPWEVRRSAFFNGVLGDALARRAAREGSHRDVDVLDLGAGDAWFAHRVKAAVPSVGAVTAWDLHYTPARLAPLRARYPELTFTADKPARRFDVVLMLDVLEHVEDDVALARGVADDLLADDGIALVSVPAWQSLFSRHDAFLLHYRRYRPAECDRVLERAGFRVLARGGLFHSLILPRTLSVAVERGLALAGRPLPALTTSGAWNHGKALTTAVSGALGVDNLVSRAASKASVALPGLSYWTVVAKASAPVGGR